MKENERVPGKINIDFFIHPGENKNLFVQRFVKNTAFFHTYGVSVKCFKGA